MLRFSRAFEHPIERMAATRLIAADHIALHLTPLSLRRLFSRESRVE
jgi:hypothetical protein